MEYREFIRRVQTQANLPDEAAAETMTKATLGTLGERLYRTLRSDLAAQLDDELKPFLESETESRVSREAVPPFGLEEFYGRVSGRVDLTVSQAAEQARAVMNVLREAVSPGMWDKMVEALPSEYSELWTGKPESGVAHTRTGGTYEVAP